MKKNNKIKKSVSVLAFLFVCAVSLILSSCSDELDIQQSYPFKVETMPVPKDIVRGQTVEIRCELKAEGKFDGTIYTIRYFQHDGKGSLRMENGTVFQPNDRYLLENEKFRLYYTSASTETQTMTVVVEDNFASHTKWSSVSTILMRRKSLREVPTNSVAYEVDDIVSLASCVGQLVCPDARGDKASLACVTF